MTGTVNDDYRAVKGTITFARGQNYRYITIPVFNDNITEPTNEFFQVSLSDFRTNNSSARGDITLATHLGVIVDNPNMVSEDHLTLTDENSCLCFPTPTPMAPAEITIPWIDDAPPVVKIDEVCYYRTDICRCDGPCTTRYPQDAYETCNECLSGNPLGDEYEICIQIGDVYEICGDVYNICGEYDIYLPCMNT